MRIIALLLVCSVVAAESDLEKKLAQADVRSARRIASLALKADKAKERATARRLFERVLVLDPKNGIARGQLGFKKRSGEWVRSSDAAVEVFARKDTDLVRVTKLRDERKKLEELRAKEVLKIAAKYGTPKRARPHIVALLRFVPRAAAVHEALGHEKVGAVYVRPELKDLVLAMKARQEKWWACGQPRETTNTGKVVNLPGSATGKTVFRIGEREVVSGYKTKNGLYVAKRTDGARQLMDLLFREDMWRYDPKRVYFVSKTQYADLVRFYEKTDERVNRATRYASYRSGSDVIAIRTGNSNDFALDLYLHCVVFWTIQGVVSPVKADGERDWNRYAWFKEGTALLTTLEVLGSATSWFSSSQESTGKAAPSLPLPDPPTRDACIEFVREQFYDGTFPPMRDIFGSSLNNLDRARAMYAWTLVRFLALFDPSGLREFPGRLHEQTEGSTADRTIRALEKAFGKPADELLRLWQAYLLELT